MFINLLAIAMKLPVDLSTETTSRVDQMEKNSGSVLIFTVTGNFMPSLGQMSNKEIVMNVAALNILVVTILVNLLYVRFPLLYMLYPVENTFTSIIVKHTKHLQLKNGI